MRGAAYLGVFYESLSNRHIAVFGEYHETPQKCTSSSAHKYNTAKVPKFIVSLAKALAPRKMAVWLERDIDNVGTTAAKRPGKMQLDNAQIQSLHCIQSRECAQMQLHHIDVRVRNASSLSSEMEKDAAEYMVMLDSWIMTSDDVIDARWEKQEVLPAQIEELRATMQFLQEKLLPTSIALIQHFKIEKQWNAIPYPSQRHVLQDWLLEPIREFPSRAEWKGIHSEMLNTTPLTKEQVELISAWGSQVSRSLDKDQDDRWWTNDADVPLRQKQSSFGRLLHLRRRASGLWLAMMDVYAMARLLRTFTTEKYGLGKQQPSIAYNVMFVGQTHAKNYRSMLKRLHAQFVFEASPADHCVEIKANHPLRQWAKQVES